MNQKSHGIGSVRIALAALGVMMGLVVAVIGGAGPARAASAEATPPAGAFIVYNGHSTDPGSLPAACTSGTPFTKIQDGVNAAELSPVANPTVYVCASTYPEPVTITKTITVLGAQAGIATSGRSNAGDEAIVNAQKGAGSDFTYLGPTGTGGTINGFSLSGNGQGASNGTNADAGILAVNGGSGYDWEYNIIEATQTGIDFNSSSTTASNTISHNEIIGNTEAGGPANAGVQFSGAPANNVTIADNVFGFQDYDVLTLGQNSPTALSTGLVVKANKSTDSAAFVYLVFTSGAQVTSNTASDPTNHVLFGGGAIGLNGDDVSPTVSGNTISEGPQAGIRVLGSYSPISTGVKISNNVVTNRGNGIEVDSSNPLDSSSFVTGNTVAGSSSDGIHVEAGSGVHIDKNTSTGSASRDCRDQTAGSNTAGTANSWTGDVGLTSSPTGICVPASAYTPVSPMRICDTRAGNPSNLGAPANQCNGHTLQSGTPMTVDVSGNGDPFGIPVDATAVVLNVTSTNATGPGFVTAYPAGTSPPTASNLNVTPGRNVANLVTVKLGNGPVSFTSNTTTDLVVDLEGYFLPGAVADLYQPAPAQRVCDTRAGNPSGLSGAALATCTGKTLAAGQSVTIPLGGFLPANVDAAVANVTAVNASSAGFLTVYPSSGTRPVASNVNFGPGQTIPNRVAVPVGTADAITVYANQPTDIIVDIDSWYSKPGASTGSLFVPQDPVRICDTRVQNPSLLTGDAIQCNNKTLQSGGTQPVAVGTHFGVPPEATAATLNLTGIQPSTLTYLTAFPSPPVPGVSDLNPGPGQIEPNMAITSLASDGSFDIFNHTGTVDVAVDLEGAYLPNTEFPPGP